MELLNLKINHKVFGTGTIISTSNNTFVVQFISKTSKFIFPDAFENFLTCEDQTLQAQINEYIKIKVQRENCQKAAREREKEAKQACDDNLSFNNGFGNDYHVEYLSKHPILTYHEIEDKFGIKISGFGRGINKTSSSIVLISSVQKKKTGFIYHDHWTASGTFIYSGEGKVGDQQMTSGNRAIVDSKQSGTPIHLFVKFSASEYYYQGVFKLLDYSYEEEKDESNNTRKEYKFQLSKTN